MADGQASLTEAEPGEASYDANASYYAVCIVRGAKPDFVSEEQGCVLLEQTEGENRWLLPRELCPNMKEWDGLEDYCLGNPEAEQALLIIYPEGEDDGRNDG